MPIKVDWFDASKGILRWEFPPTWTVDEYNSAVEYSRRIAEHIPAYYILSYGAERTPPDIIKAAMKAHRQAQSRYRFSVNVTSNQFVRLIGQIVDQFPAARSKIYFAASETDALALIERDRAELAAQRPSTSTAYP